MKASPLPSSPLPPPRPRREVLADWVRPFLEFLGLPHLSRPALNELDRKLERLLPQKNGVFVEAGGNDGFRQSNTYYFSRFKGWTGVLVEALPDLAALCQKRRPESHVVACALGAPEQAGGCLKIRQAGLMSAVCGALGDEEAERQRALQGLRIQGMAEVDEVHEVPVRTLNDVLDSCRVPPDFGLLSLDVEGYEVEVLKGLDLQRFRPQAICIEVQKTNLDAVASFLSPHYHLAEVLHEGPTHGDYFWRRKP